MKKETGPCSLQTRGSEGLCRPLHKLLTELQLHKVLSNVKQERLSGLLYILEVLGSNLGSPYPLPRLRIYLSKPSGQCVYL